MYTGAHNIPGNYIPIAIEGLLVLLSIKLVYESFSNICLVSEMEQNGKFSSRDSAFNSFDASFKNKYAVFRRLIRKKFLGE